MTLPVDASDQLDFSLLSGRFRSLAAPLDWKGIPRFAVLTGINGSGKSQFLQLLQRAVTRNQHPTPEFQNVRTKITGPQFGELDVALIGADWGLPGVQPATLQQLEHDTRRVAQQLLDSSARSEHLKRLRKEYQTLISETGSVEALAARLPAKVLLGEQRLAHTLLQQLGHVFRNHHLDRCDLQLKQKPPSEIDALLGPPPWQLANRVLAESSIPYRLTTPEGLGIRDAFLLEVVAEDTGAQVPAHMLSSGERVLFSLIVAMFVSREYRVMPKLLLLDEPDAHLHTAQIGHFLQMLRETLVVQYGCRVVMSTHRPDTIVQLKPGELFEMRRSTIPRIVPCEHPARVLGLMTARVVDVLPSVRCILVEDEADVAFYDNVTEALIAEGKLVANPALSFRTPSVGSGSDKTGAGCKVVIASVASLRGAGVTIVHGLVDGDGLSEAPGDGVSRLARHSIENYLFDPLNVFARLVEVKAAPPIAGVGPLRSGDQHQLRTFDSRDLQLVVDHVVRLFEEPLKITDPEKARRDAKLVSGQTLSLPSWLWTRRGHDIQRAAYALDPNLTTKALVAMLLGGRLIYDELHARLLAIQQS